MNALSAAATRFLARNPTYMGTVAGHRFYEHPTYGDESPLVVIAPNGEASVSDFWELPTVEEITF